MSVREICDVFIDYEGLLVGASYNLNLDVDDLIFTVIPTAQQRYDLRAVYIFGDWRRLGSRTKLERRGFICIHTLAGNTARFSRVVYPLLEEIGSEDPADVYLFIGGKSDYYEAIRQVREVEREVVLWTITPPAPADRSLCREHQMLTVPGPSPNSPSWPRAAILHALVLINEEYHRNGVEQIEIADMGAALANYPQFATYADVWLNIAIHEQILFLHLNGETLHVSLNRQHSAVQDALNNCACVVATMRSMGLVNLRITFDALDKALRSYMPLSTKRRLRHAWIDMLAQLEILVFQDDPASDQSAATTVINLDQDHPLVAAYWRDYYFNAVRLVVLLDQYHHIHQKRITEAALLNRLTRFSNRSEARATLLDADRRALVQFYTYPDSRRIFVALDYEQDNVTDILAQRDAILTFIRARRFADRGRSISKSFLIEELTTHFDRRVATFWVQLFIHLNMLTLDNEEIPSLPGGEIQKVDLNSSDPVIRLILDEH